MKRILEIILATYARLTLKIHKPKIVGITGSVGKSSTKEAVALVLRQKFRVGASSGNLNSQLGLPLSVLGFQKPGGFKKNFASLLQWLWIAILGFFRIFRTNFPEILVLEMGVDKPGDIAYLLGITGKLDAAVITDIGISHIEFFPSINALTEEKLSLLKGLKRDGVMVLNADNPKVASGSSGLKSGWVYTFGFGKADVQAVDFETVSTGNERGVTFNLVHKGASARVLIPNTIGKPIVYASLAAASVGLALGMSLNQVARALGGFRQPAGRLRMIEGINHSLVIDDSYNAAPSSTIAALEAAMSIPARRKFAAIGHMAELGVESEKGHREVGDKIAELKLDAVFLVGEKTKATEDELKADNFQGVVRWFANSDEARQAIKESLRDGDLIVVKGSQSARMEKIVKEIMAHPQDAKDLLVRQSKQWMD